MANTVTAARRVQRWWYMLRNVPPGQLWRRVELRVRGRCARFWKGRLVRGPLPPCADFLPSPLFSPRSDQGVPMRDGFVLATPWGRRSYRLPVNWHSQADNPIEASWRTRLHYMEFLEGLPPRLQEEVIADWIRSNPFDGPAALHFAWHPFATSIRVVVWMQQIARHRTSLSDRFIELAMPSIVAQLRFIERQYECDVRGNHLVKNIKALLWGAAFFTGPDRERWRQLAMRLLDGELAEQILSDGVHYERSPTYHCQVMADLLECHAVLPDGHLRNDLAAVLQKMGEAAARLTHPDGLVAQFNDASLSNAYRSDQCLDVLSRIAAPVRQADGPFALPDAGFFGMRHHNDYLIVDCGQVAPASLVAHGHGDILSFEWSLDGQRIFVDQGTYQYAAGPRRELSRSTCSHNTVTIDDEEQCDFYGAHRCGRRARAKLLKWQPQPTGFILEGSHDGFSHLAGAPRHVRRFEVSPRQLVIEDCVTGTPLHTARFRLLCHPACEVSADGHRAMIRRGATIVELTAPSPICLEDAEWYPEMYVAHPTKRISFDLPSSGRISKTVVVAR